jgi:hypothetical protein
MDEQAEKLADGPAPESKPNPGRFIRGDARINRQGRPRGSRKAAAGADPADLAPQTDQLRRLVLPESVLVSRLGEIGYFVHLDPVARLPYDARIVAARVDQNGRVVLVLRSGRFPLVAAGTIIPEFTGTFAG